MKRRVFAVAVVAVVLMSMTPAHGGSVVWGNSASAGNVNLEAFDAATGLLIPGQQFLVPNATAVNDNGRGVAVLGNDIYYTTANSGNIYKTNTITHADLGIVVNTGFAGIANIATDGTFLYANDYQATNGVINKYTPSGVLVGSITLSGPDAVGASSRDGFEVQNNPNILGGATTFIANRYDGGFGPMLGSTVGAYDVYDSTGVEIISGFITPNAQGTAGATGIAYDGNHYFVSDIFLNRLLEYDGLGNFVGYIDLSANPNPPSGTRQLEDLSAVGNTVTNPGCGNNQIDPGEQCDGSDASACPGQCLPPGNPNECMCPPPTSCGNAFIDPGEDCDPPGSITCPPGSPAGAFLPCSANCTCPVVVSTTTSTVVSSTSTTTTTLCTPTPENNKAACNDRIDNDCDTLIDCLDPECFNVTPCRPARKDPTIIKFSGRPGLDRFRGHATLDMPPVDLSTTEVAVLLTNPVGKLYEAVLGPGSLTARSATTFQFRDPAAKRGEGNAQGIYTVKLKKHRDGSGYTMAVDAFSNLSAATDARMRIQFYVADGVFITTDAAWSKIARGWRAPKDH